MSSRSEPQRDGVVAAARKREVDLGRDGGSPQDARTGDSLDWLAARFPWTRQALLSVLLTAAIVCMLSIILRTEIVPSDPWGYVNSARNFPDDSWVPLGYTRYGMVLPRVPLTWLFGNATATYYFWPILSSALLAACLYLIAYRFWGQIFGILAVVLGLSSPITFINLTRGYPDIQSTAIVTLAVVLALVIRDRLLSGHRATWWLWLSVGFLLGWGFETRETTILTWPIVAVALWTKKVSARGIALLAVGIATWAVTDIVIGAVAYGDPLIRVHVFTNQDLATTTIPGDLAAQQQFVGRNRLYYLGVIPTKLATGGGVWSLVLGALTLVGLVFRGGSRFVSLWFLLCYLTFVGITGGFFPDHPSGRIDVARYWICFLPLAGLSAAGTTAEIAARICRRLTRHRRHRVASLPRPVEGLRTWSATAVQRMVNVVLAVLVAIGPLLALTGSAIRNPQLTVNGADQLAQLRTFLASNEPDNPRILADLATARLIPIYQRGDFGGRDLWSADVVNLNRYPEPRSGDLVVINSLGSQSCYFCGRQGGTWYEKYGPIPDDWELVWTSDPAHLTIYRVPQ